MQEAAAAADEPAKAKFTAETARAALEGMEGSILFEKVLTSSDANGTGRLVIPKSQAEVHFPYLEQQTGMVLKLTDTNGNQHSFRFRFWINNQSRMYLLENTTQVLAQYKMAAGDVLVFAKLPDGNYAICGRKGTKDDVSRKPAVRRSTNDASPLEGGKHGSKRARSRGADSAKTKRLKQKQAAQAVSSMFTYWSAHSLPMKKDGVFRAVPNTSAAQEGDKVVAQCGAWSAIVSMGGELFQAFFDTLDAANTALEAALQTSAAGQAEEEAAVAAVVAAVAGAGTPNTVAGGTPAEDSTPGSRDTSVEPSTGLPAATAAAVGGLQAALAVGGTPADVQQQQQPVKAEERQPEQEAAMQPLAS